METKEPNNSKLPQHIAIIMDGNGRWAQQRKLPRVAGHRAGVKTVRKIVEYCGQIGIEALTLFAFSSENWQRPQQEVSLLMGLFIATIQKETSKLHESGVCIKFIGNISVFTQELQNKMVASENITKNNNNLTLTIAVNYGGRWDITQATQEIAKKTLAGKLAVTAIDEQLITAHLSTKNLAEPDLFIRTGGEKRISNFLLWQLAYTEFYFIPTFWPDFDQKSLQTAIKCFQGRQRRFGFV